LPGSNTLARTGGESIFALAKRDGFIAAIFVSLLLLGADELAIRVAGLSIRLAFPALLVGCLFLYFQMKEAVAFDKILAWLFFAFALAGACSTFRSYAPTKSIGYTIWVLFDFFVIIGICYNFARAYAPRTVLSAWLSVFRIHAVLIFLELLWGFATHHPSRPKLWFYETSYLAIFMSAYFGSALYLYLRKEAGYRFDFYLATIAIIATTSATGLFGVAFAIALNFLIARQRVRLLLGTSVLVALSLGTLFLFFQKTVFFQLAVGFLFNNDDVIHLLLMRGGNRVIRALVGWQAFVQHPWFGIGIGGDSAYMEQASIPDSAREYLTKYSNLGVGQPFCNIFIEVLGTTGLIGFIPFIAIILYAVRRFISQVKGNISVEATAFFIGFFSVLLSLQLEGTVLRYYLWSPLGLALGVMARNYTVAWHNEASPSLGAPLLKPR